MKKFFLATVCFITALLPTFFNTDSIKASTMKTTSDPVLTGDPDVIYSDLTLGTTDWSDVIEIVILYDDGSSFGEDSILYYAEKHNIPVKYELTLVPRFTHFNSIYWLLRGDELSLNLKPKEPYMIQKEPAWAEAYNYFKDDYRYTGVNNPTKYKSMYNQFVCHADFAVLGGYKVVWNIEAWRPDKGYYGFVQNSCN